jgi:hypothetical protein
MVMLITLKGSKMSETTKVENTVIANSTKIGSVVEIDKKSASYAIQRKVSCDTIGREIASRITGKLIGFDDLFDPKTNTFKTEEELKACGATFVSVSLNKVLGDTELVKKSRFTKNPTPFIRKDNVVEYIANINWASFVNKRGHGDFIPAEAMTNGVEYFCECKAIGKTRAGNLTINGVAHKIVKATKYYDENGVEYSDIKSLKNEFFKKTWDAEQKSRQKEADKHGIDVRFDPQFRTTRIDSCDSIRAFKFDYIPTE